MILVLISHACSSGLSDIQVEQLSCEYQKTPLAVDQPHPSLNWVLTGQGRGQVQTAYEIIVSSSEKKLKNDQGDVWHTGRIESDRNRHIKYEGEPLRSKTAYYWKVRIWDRNGKPSHWSETGKWNMGMLEAGDWQQAKWIGSSEIFEEAECNVAPLSHWIWHPRVKEADRNVFFRREIQVDTSAAFVKLDISAYHRYVLWVNGKIIGDVNRDWNTPTIAHYQLYFKRNLVPGKNVIAVQASSREGQGALACGIEIIRKEQGGTEVLDPLGWTCSDKTDQSWYAPGFTPKGWAQAVSVAKYGEPPYGELESNPAMASPLLRKEIKVHGKVKRAMVYMSGLGFSELYINGSKADDWVLDPEFIDYSIRVPYVVKEITSLLVEGSNVIGIILGGGYYKEAVADMFDFQDAPWSDQPKLFFHADIEYTDGTSQILCSDESWKSATGAILFNSLRGGETLDLRKATKGWMLSGYDASNWNEAMLLDAPAGRLVAKQVQPARVMEEIDPVSVTEPVDGIYLFDMGVNITGWSELRTSGREGQIIIMDYNERLYPDGTLDINHGATHTYGRYQTDKLILSGHENDVFEPRFTQHSFRYVQATGLTGKPSKDDLKGKWVHTDIGHAGSFECSNEKLNKIQQAIVRGYQNYILHHPLDPLREKMGWTQDVWNMFEAGAYNFEVARVYRKWFYDFLDAQDHNGHVPPVIPANYWGRTTAEGEPGQMSDPWWGGALVYLPRFLYDYYGDLSVLRMGFPAMKEYVDYIGTTAGDYLVSWTLGDWGDVSHMEKGGMYRLTPVVESSTCAWYYLATLVQEAAVLLGKSEDAEKYGTLVEKIRESFNRHFFDQKKGIYRTPSQSAQILPLYLGMVPVGNEDQVLEWIVTDIRKHDNHLTTGFVGILPLLDELSNRGRTDIAYQLACQETYPSWYHMLKDGGTTITEYWNPDQGSKNIINLGGPLGAWFYKYLAGIRPLQPSFREYTLQPYFAEELNWMKATFYSPCGEIKSHWERSEDNITYEVQIPVNTMAQVSLPVADPSNVSINGKPLGSEIEMVISHGKDQNISFTLGSGTYLIRF